MQRIKMEHHLNHQMLVTTAATVIDSGHQSPIIAIASNTDHPKNSSSNEQESNTIKETNNTAIVSMANHEVETNQSQSVNSNVSMNSNENGGGKGIKSDSEQTRPCNSNSSHVKTEDESGNKSPHTHVITEAPSSRAEPHKSHIGANTSLNSLSQQSTPSISPATSMVLPVQDSPEPMTNNSGNSSNANTITIQELTHAQISGNEQMTAWHLQAINRAQPRTIYGSRLTNTLNIEQERDNDSPHPNTNLESNSPSFYVQQLHHR